MNQPNLSALINQEELIREAMRLLGQRTSKRKAKSSAANAIKARQARAKKKSLKKA
jgi:hypothetical protein